MDDVRVCTIRAATRGSRRVLRASLRGAAIPGFVWDRRELNVAFLDGSRGLRGMVKYYMNMWGRYGAVKFVERPDRPAEIRVTFLGEGAWSYIGADALAVPVDQPTMCLGWLRDETPRSEIRRTTLHETGHALGLIHEHQNPEGGIPWNKPAVYAFYEGPPNYWSREDVDHNIFAAYGRDELRLTRFDPLSIMCYPVDAAWVTDPNYAVGWNDRLSATDKHFIGTLYPFRSTTPPSTRSLK